MKQLLAILITGTSLATLFPTTQAQFTDVENQHPYAEAINYVQGQGYVQGYADGSYRPDTLINRAEFTKILAEARYDHDIINTCLKSRPKLFSDVRKEDWFSKYLCIAQMDKVITGYPDGSFRPVQNINLAEAAKIIVGSYGFRIESIPQVEWYVPYIAVLEALSSRPESATEATDKVSRGEMAFIIAGIDQAFAALEPGEPLRLNLQIPVEDGGSTLDKSEDSYQAQHTDPYGGAALLKQQVLDLTNQQREAQGLQVLSHNEQLATAAQSHAEDMLEQGYFDHDSLDGRSPFDRIEASGYLKVYYNCNCTKSYETGENIAKGQQSAAEVLETWMNSPEHRDNILNPEFTEIGIGIIPVADDDQNYQGYFWVQNFGDITLIKP